MTMGEFDTILAELKANGHYTIILDFTAQLSGNEAITNSLRNTLSEEKLIDQIHILKIKHTPWCDFAKMYSVTQAPQFVAISVLNKIKTCKKEENLVNFIQENQEEGLRL